MKFWQKVKRSLAGRGNCHIGKVEDAGKIIKKAPDKKPGRKVR